ncbi:DNA polymerase III subunit beta [Actinomyces vulturis]|uniref:DNA polymerase III subunit beta n=1 Tax=Actinomyces vulturis TaxID=1857645 RepID=UPI00082F0153|nr:DNA polymerase III subunit beta [Actinomyces vulturis]
MRFTVDRDVFAEAVTWAARSVPARPPVPVLAGVRLHAENDELTFASFDYEVSALCSVPAQVEISGTVLVSGRLLAEISKVLPKNRPVNIEVEGNKVNITSGSAHFTLASMAADDYPSLPGMPRDAGTIDASELSHAVSQVSIAASRDDTLPLLTSILMEVQGTQLTLLATDRYRLAMREMTWAPIDESFETHALIKSRTLVDVAKQLTASGDITVSLSTGDDVANGMIGFEGRSGSSTRRTTSLLTDGNYPPVRRLFPESSSIFADVPTAELIDAVKRVSLVADRLTPIRLSFTQGNLSLDAGTGDDAQATEQLQAHVDGDDIVIAFNPAFLLDGLGAVGTPYARFAFTHSTKPAMMTGVNSIGGTEDLSFRYLLMPHRYGV